MFYPGNYGFIPHTLADDGDPVDVVVIGPTPVVPGAIVRSRAIGALMMEDEAGGDDKIIAVPVDKLHPYYSNIGSYRDLPEILREQVKHFFEHYKDLERGKWVKFSRWAEPEEAMELIRKGIQASATSKRRDLSETQQSKVGAAPYPPLSRLSALTHPRAKHSFLSESPDALSCCDLRRKALL